MCVIGVQLKVLASLVGQMIKKLKVLVAQSCLTLCDSVHCNPSDSLVHGILQARILEWAAICFSRGSSLPRDQTCASCLTSRFFTAEPMGSIVWIKSYVFWKYMYTQKGVQRQPLPAFTQNNHMPKVAYWGWHIFSICMHVYFKCMLLLLESIK